ncbi:MAG: N-acetylmuramoyl-L-alanine amidase [Desulfuromonadales bacterium]|nr:N-acetylmuramoyl-L-alanine amidase [Desulfuromonadales bacterium]
MKFTRQIDTIVIHCSDSPNGRNDKAKDIDLWHRQRGRSRTDFWRLKKGFNPDLTSIGYHFVIDLCGMVETGRPPDETGAHVKDHNSTSIGICLIGKDRFTPEQPPGDAQNLQRLLSGNGGYQLHNRRG